MVDITSQVIQDFRDYYPEFTDTNDWTDTFLTRFLCEGDEETGSPRWGKYDDGACSLKKRGMFAFTAHKAVLGKVAKTAVENGGTPGAPNAVQSKSVADESISFAINTPSSAAEAAEMGDFDTTIYGKEFARLRRRAGAGAVVV